MCSSVKVGLVAALVLSAAYGCGEEGTKRNGSTGGAPDRDARSDEGGPGDPDDDDDGDDREDGGAADDAGGSDPDGGGGDRPHADAGMGPVPNRPPANPPEEPGPSPSPKTEVPDELVGAWQSSPIDFALWENYTEGYYAGRNAVPSREAMIFYEDGDAKFYRYEFAFTFYEELIDCEGTVAFHDDGTFTFYPVSGRMRFYDSRHSDNSTDRALTDEDLVDPKLAGTRAYVYEGESDPAALLITVPSSAPYYWYEKE